MTSSRHEWRPGRRTYPHPAVADGRSVLRQPQHKQVHLVLPPAADTEAEALDALLQLHGEEVKVLRELRIPEVHRNRHVMRSSGRRAGKKTQQKCGNRNVNTRRG